MTEAQETATWYRNMNALEKQARSEGIDPTRLTSEDAVRFRETGRINKPKRPRKVKAG